ncbi:MAG: undecaprenyl/decaprenyl-phosphate alpha-N-acetylglucosaminyl 1-phosphate transferase [Candidatus Omnitrophica bacterium]|nr:undecaprenyl/decaprenyl-phosphate alpha-N-acetylglucosaminyl 1-phosphate transferase [Candidatus Omnitrophota bacterium]
MALSLLPYILVPFFIVLAATALVLRFSFRLGIVAVPRDDRWNKKPTSLLGGAGIFLGFAASYFILCRPDLYDGMPFLLGATGMFLTGILDDKFSLSVLFKITLQFISVLAFFFFSGYFNLSGAHFFGVIFLALLLWVAGVTNALNLLDNMDGLACGIAAIAGIFFALILWQAAYSFAAGVLFGWLPGAQVYIALIICGCALGFLFYNFNPAKIFMGNSGSMFLGYSLAVLALSAAFSAKDIFQVVAIPVMVLIVPLFDTFFVAITRALERRPIYKGGIDHLSHRLARLGLSDKKVTLIFYAIAVFFGALAFGYSVRPSFIIVAVSGAGVLAMGLSGVFIFKATSRLS